MSIITSNIFLFLIAIFSFYLAFSGMRFARNRKDLVTTMDWISVSLMILFGIGMWLIALLLFLDDDSYFIVLLVLGFLAITLGYGDFKSHKNKTARERKNSKTLNQYDGWHNSSYYRCSSCKCYFRTNMDMMGASNSTNNTS